MNTDFLTTFLSVVQTRSFTRTAAITNLSQSTVSNRIIELEKFFNCKLFHRLNGKVEATSAGKTLVNYAEDIITTQHQALSVLNNINLNLENIQIGCVHAFYDCFFSPLISNFLESNFNYALNIFLKHSREIIHGVISGKYDVGITHHPSNYHRYHSKLVFKDRLIFVSSELNEKYVSGIPFSELRDLPVFNANFFDQHIEELMFNKNVFKLSIDIGAKIIPFLLENKAYAFLPESYVQKYVRSKQLYEVPIVDYSIPPLEYYLVYSKEYYEHSSLKEQFITKIINTFEKTG